ncbi:putative aldolase [Arthrobacter globiformis NBRC 12137]|uniref:Putative 4-hydroxy-4-methyl-2-oxoglutarate aldolase n=1 Tax=Arthrobacter globiformis (strain ATCC 8010 / DSM 20124 / JCM 1332 / NBRC 12137 / NCIMB 8907 / NRRL B-2979 / 168) TaxID=1077972 RepID=H0QSU4_ARTG1|nr:diguanylate cyclase [Arthrobacter globiformis]GAB15895.1 putative aldolase [Arthrobacter globiformis NBRC 12137]
MNTTTSDIAARLKAIPTASISDAMDSLGIHGTLHGLAPLTYDFRIGGPAFTVQYEPAGSERGSVGDFLDDVPPGAVVLIDNHARTDVTVWGGIMTEIAAARGIGGTVINGVCRDLNAALRQNYPLFSRGRFMRTGKDRVRLVAVNAPVTINDVEISPLDIICGDADGALAVPASRAEEIAEIAERIEGVEARIIEAVKAGSTLVQARADLGYHDLQWRKA